MLSCTPFLTRWKAGRAKMGADEPCIRNGSTILLLHTLVARAAFCPSPPRGAIVTPSIAPRRARGKLRAYRGVRIIVTSSSCRRQRIEMRVRSLFRPCRAATRGDKTPPLDTVAAQPTRGDRTPLDTVAAQPTRGDKNRPSTRLLRNLLGVTHAPLDTVAAQPTRGDRTQPTRGDRGAVRGGRGGCAR